MTEWTLCQQDKEKVSERSWNSRNQAPSDNKVLSAVAVTDIGTVILNTLSVVLSVHLFWEACKSCVGLCPVEPTCLLLSCLCRVSSPVQSSPVVFSVRQEQDEGHPLRCSPLVTALNRGETRRRIFPTTYSSRHSRHNSKSCTRRRRGNAGSFASRSSSH